MPTINVKVIDRTNLPAKLKTIIGGAERGVKLAAEDGVHWVQIEVVQNQGFLGDPNYPDVTDATKRIKAKKGKELVGKDTGNWVASFNSDVKGLVGTIKGGGAKYGTFQARWQVGPLYMEHRAGKACEIIEGEIKKKI